MQQDGARPGQLAPVLHPAHRRAHELHPPPGPPDLGLDLDRLQRDRPEELHRQPRELHLGRERLERPHQQRRRRAAVHLPGIPRPDGVTGGDERVPVPPEDHPRSSLRTTSFSPDHVSSTAATLTSTSPSGSASSRIVSSVMSVSTPTRPLRPRHPRGARREHGVLELRKPPLKLRPRGRELHEDVEPVAQPPRHASRRRAARRAGRRSDRAPTATPRATPSLTPSFFGSGVPE